METRLERLKKLCAYGDMDEADYRLERDEIQAEIATFQGSGARVSVLKRKALFLSGLPAAWAAATPEQGNRLAQTLFSRIVVRDAVIDAVEPTSEFRPFFALDYLAQTQNDDLNGSS